MRPPEHRLTLPGSRILGPDSVADDLRNPFAGRLQGLRNRFTGLRGRTASRLSMRAALEAQDDIATTLLSVNSETRGLHEDEAARRLARHGPNRLTAASPRRRSAVLRAALTDLQSLSLLLTGLIALLADPANLPGFLILTVLVLLTAVGALIRNRANLRTAHALEALAGTGSTVLRRQGSADEPEWSSISSHELVRGDIIQLSPGYRVPADLRLMESQQLTVDQSLMTGDSSPVPKHASGAGGHGRQQLRSDPFDPPGLANVCLTGSFVLSGTGSGVVVATGEQTYYGSMARALLHDHGDAWEIQFGSSLFLPRLLLLLPVAGLFRAGYGTGLPGLLWLALAAVVYLLPELLPGLFLPRSVRTERESGAIESLAGWLSRLRGGAESRPARFREADIELVDCLDHSGSSSLNTLRYAWLLSSLSPVAADAVDTAVVRFAADRPELDEHERFQLIDQIPYELRHRRHCLVAAGSAGQHLLVSRGNPDRILEVASLVRVGREQQRLDSRLRAQLQQQIRVQVHQGQFVQLIATRLIPPNQAKRLYSVADERNLTVEGLLVFSAGSPDAEALSPNTHN